MHNARLDLVLRGAIERGAQRKGDIVEDRQCGQEIEALEYHCDVAFHRRDMGHVYAVEPDRPGVWPVQARNAPERGGLAGPGRTENAEHLSLTHREINSIERLLDAEALAQALYFNDGPLHARHSRRDPSGPKKKQCSGGKYRVASLGRQGRSTTRP